MRITTFDLSKLRSEGGLESISGLCVEKTDKKSRFAKKSKSFGDARKTSNVTRGLTDEKRELFLFYFFLFDAGRNQTV